MEKCHVFTVIALLAMLIAPFQAAADAAGSANQDASSSDSAASASPNPPDGQAETPIRADSIERVDMRQADLINQSLYGARPEDQQALQNLTVLLRQIIEAGKLFEDTKPKEPGWHFFLQMMSVEFKDGTSMELYPEGLDAMVYSLNGKTYKASGKQWLNELSSYFKDPERANVNVSRAAVGETVRIKGSDMQLEHGTLYIFLNKGDWSRKVSAQGIDYPSKGAILIGRAPIEFGRYDVSMVVPSKGMGFDGKLVPIEPGNWNMDFETSWMGTSAEFTVVSAKSPVLTINGIPAQTTNANPLLIDGRMMIPLRPFAKLIGQPIAWDGKSNRVLIGTGNVSNQAERSSRVQLRINGYPTPVSPELINGVSYIPVRLAANAFGYKVQWLSKLNAADIAIKPVLLDPQEFADQPDRQAIVKIVNDYVTSFNARNEAVFNNLFASNAQIFPNFDLVGNRIITACRDIRFEDRPGGALLAYAGFQYIFDPFGNTEAAPGIVFKKENGEWKIADVD